MAEMGQTRSFGHVRSMSGLSPRADLRPSSLQVAKGDFRVHKITPDCSRVFVVRAYLAVEQAIDRGHV
jgi:hypothetical protein